MRLFVDHTAGKHGRGAVLADETGRRALGLNGAWAETDDGGRTLLFVAPDCAAVAKASVVDGLISGALGVDSSSPARLRNVGPGHQTVKRTKVPVRDLTGRWNPSRDRRASRAGGTEASQFAARLCFHAVDARSNPDATSAPVAQSG